MHSFVIFLHLIWLFTVIWWVCVLLQLTISDQPIAKMSNTVEPQDVDKTNQKQPEEIRIETIQEQDTEEVLAMLKEYFFKVSKMNKKNAIFKVGGRFCLFRFIFRFCV